MAALVRNTVWSLLLLLVAVNAEETVVSLKLLGYTDPAKMSATEQVAFDDQEKVAYVVGGSSLHLVDLAVTPADLATTPADGRQLTILTTKELPATATDVQFCGGYLAVSTEGETKVAPGIVQVYSRYQRSAGNESMQLLETFTVGSLPDQIEYNKDCSMLLVSNEGEPDGYGEGFTDPEGSVSIINFTYCPEDTSACGGKAIKGTIRTATFSAYSKEQLLRRGIKINGPGSTAAQDLEPEYTTFAEDEKTAFVSLQEANAIAVLDIATAKITHIQTLGLKNHNVKMNSMDASDKDGKINIATWPVWGMYMPDEIRSFRHQGVDYVVTANEGDARDWEGFTEEARLKDVITDLDPKVFPDAATTLGKDDQLGRLNLIADKNILNDANSDGKYDKLLSYGGRSFSIFMVNKTSTGAVRGLRRVFDSRNQLEQISKKLLPKIFNSEGTPDTLDGRSDNKGPEPEGVAIGDAFSAVHGSKRCLFLTTERLGAVFVYDISNPTAPVFQSLALPPQKDGQAMMRGPEGITYARYTVGAELTVPIVLVAYETGGASGLGVYLVETKAA